MRCAAAHAACFGATKLCANRASGCGTYTQVNASPSLSASDRADWALKNGLLQDMLDVLDMEGKRDPGKVRLLVCLQDDLHCSTSQGNAAAGRARHGRKASANQEHVYLLAGSDDQWITTPEGSQRISS